MKPEDWQNNAQEVMLELLKCAESQNKTCFESF